MSDTYVSASQVLSDEQISELIHEPMLAHTLPADSIVATLVIQRAVIAHLRKEAQYTDAKGNVWPRYLFTGWECNECHWRTHYTAKPERCPQGHGDWAIIGVYWRRGEDEDGLASAAPEEAVEALMKPKAAPVNAIASMKAHIALGHPGPWGNCEDEGCVRDRAMLPRG